MILYTNPERIFGGEGYDNTYRHNADRFGHAITFRALDELFDRHLQLAQPLRALDLGCGQGQVISYVRQKVQVTAPHFADVSAYYGVDISQVAIEQCERRDPAVWWIVDSFQDFLARVAQPEQAAQFQGTLDLVINKGGLTQVRSAHDYHWMLEGIRDLLRHGGIYLFVQYKQFYQVWSNEHCLDWDTDIFELAEQALGEPIVLEDESAYIRIHRKSPARGHKVPRQRARRIVFHMNDGSKQPVFVSSDELTTQRLHRLRAAPDREAFFAFDLPARAKEKGMERLRDRVRAAREAFVPGRPHLLLASGRVRMRDAAAVDPYQALFRSLSERYNVIPWPGTITTVRHLCKAVTRWSAVRPDYVVIGPGLEDFKIDLATAQPIVDPDEYRHRMEWVLDVLVNEAGAQVIYLATLPAADFEDDRYEYRRHVAGPFVEAASQVCAAYGVGFDDVRRALRSNDRNAVIGAIVERGAALLSARVGAACAS